MGCQAWMPSARRPKWASIYTHPHHPDIPCPNEAIALIRYIVEDGRDWPDGKPTKDVCQRHLEEYLASGNWRREEASVA